MPHARMNCLGSPPEDDQQRKGGGENGVDHDPALRSEQKCRETGRPHMNAREGARGAGSRALPTDPPPITKQSRKQASPARKTSPGGRCTARTAGSSAAPPPGPTPPCAAPPSRTRAAAGAGPAAWGEQVGGFRGGNERERKSQPAWGSRRNLPRPACRVRPPHQESLSVDNHGWLIRSQA